MKNKFFLLILYVVVATGVVFAQEENQQNQQTDQTYSGDYIDLTQEAIRIERKVEMPRVSIFDTRIKPEFDQIAINKSFLKEISGKNEELKFKLNKSLNVEAIKNVENLIKKNR